MKPKSHATFLKHGVLDCRWFVMATSGSAESFTVERGRNETPGSRRWLDVTVLWAAAVSAYALVLFLLAQFQMQRMQAWEMEQIVSALRDGNVKQAAMYGAEPITMLYPTSVLLQFAVLGLAVIATAWLGRRALAVALPLAVTVASLAPAYWGEGSLAPHPLGENDWNSWGSLASAPAMESYRSLPLWPLMLGSAVQVTLLLLPLMVAPSVRTNVPVKEVVLRAAIPAAALATLALAFVPAPSAQEILRAPLVALALSLLVTALASGRGPITLRVGAAVAIPAALAPIVLSTSLDNAVQGWALAAVAAGGAVFILTLTAALTWLRERFGSPRDAAIETAPAH